MSKIEQLFDIDNNELDWAGVDPAESWHTEPSEVDWAIADLDKAIDTLEREKSYLSVDDIKDAHARLGELIDELEIPF